MACLSGSGMRLCLKKMNDLSWGNNNAVMMRMNGCVGVGRKQRRVNMMMGRVQGKFKGTQMREKQLTEMIEKKVMEAKEVCLEGNPITDECKVAWDEVEEVSQAKADLRLKLEKNKDPLESFCQDNPETDECRIYED